MEQHDKIIETESVRQRVADLKNRISEMADYIGISERRKKLADLEAKQAEPDFWNDQKRAREVIDATNAERAYVQPYEALEKSAEDAAVMLELAEMEEALEELPNVEEELQA